MVMAELGENRRANTHKMTYEKITPSVYEAHESVAHEVATQYVENLVKDKDGSFGSLDAMLSVFRFEVAAMFHQRAHALGAYRMAYRPALLANMAKSEVRRRLVARPDLERKLFAIRAAQK